MRSLLLPSQRTPSLFPDELSAVPGDTPLMAYDLARVSAQVQSFDRAFGGRVGVRYAVKCNPDPRVLQAVAAAGGGFEVASLPELQLAVAAGARPQDVLYSNPVKPPEHVAGAWAQGLTRFAVDTPSELAKVAQHAPGGGVYVRVRVDDTSSRFPLSAKFGAPLQEARELLLAARDLGLRPEGLTFHVGSQCTDADAWSHAVTALGPVLRALLADGIRLRLLDLGGGFPARYAPDEQLPDLDDVGARVLAALDALPYVPQEVVCEPGRALVAEAGTLVATVIGLAERQGRLWVYTDVGAYNGLMEAAQTSGRLPYPVSSSRPGPLVHCTVTGPSCDSSDTLLHDAVLPADVEVGDRLLFGSAGAYSLCYAAPFNGFPVPRPFYLD